MKISKLFHWLYAIVMLLPVFAFASTILVNSFNKEVTQPTQEVEVNYKYETNEVNSLDDLIVGNIYHFHADLTKSLFDFLEGGYLGGILLVTQDFEITLENMEMYDYTFNFINSNYQSEISFFFTESDITFRYPNGDYYIEDLINYSSNGSINFDFVLVEFNNIWESQLTSYISSSSFNQIESVDITEHDTSVNNIFYYAVDKVTESPLFSWAYDSFLVAPFSYIVALFGMPTNHVVVELLSYWLAISIIWLVFDLVMYVPLLVHRWLDKGVLE